MHGDVKVSNIVVDRDGSPHLIDWDCACDEREARRSGTPGWMAPELLEHPDECRMTHKADMYGLGCVLATLLVRMLLALARCPMLCWFFKAAYTRISTLHPYNEANVNACSFGPLLSRQHCRASRKLLWSNALQRNAGMWPYFAFPCTVHCTELHSLCSCVFHAFLLVRSISYPNCCAGIATTYRLRSAAPGAVCSLSCWNC